MKLNDGGGRGCGHFSQQELERDRKKAFHFDEVVDALDTAAAIIGAPSLISAGLNDDGLEDDDIVEHTVRVPIWAVRRFREVLARARKKHPFAEREADHHEKGSQHRYCSISRKPPPRDAMTGALITPAHIADTAKSLGLISEGDALDRAYRRGGDNRQALIASWLRVLVHENPQASLTDAADMIESGQFRQEGHLATLECEFDQLRTSFARFVSLAEREALDPQAFDDAHAAYARACDARAA